MGYPKLTDKDGALETAARVRKGELSPHEAIEDAIGRIEHLDAHINAVAVCDFERAIATAKAMDGTTPGEHQPLFGVPIGVKDIIDVAGLPTVAGSPSAANAPLCRTMIRSASERMTSILCSTSRIVRSMSAFSFWITACELDS